ncbi:hypothetical protein Tco_1243783 [Tanacetum coccineum]
MHTTSLQNTTNDSKQKPRSNNQTSRSLPVSKSRGVTSNSVPLVDHSRNSSSFSDSKHFVCSTCHKCVFNANHDACLMKFLKEVNSHVKVQSPKTRNSNNLVEPKIHTQKHGRQIVIGHRFSLNKSSVVGPTGKILTSSITKVDCEPPNGSNDVSLPIIDVEPNSSLYSLLQIRLQAPLLKEKKGVRFSALYLRKKRNLLVYDHSYQKLVNQHTLTCLLLLSSNGHMASEQSSSGPALHELTPGTLSSRLVPQPPSPIPFVPPTRTDWDTLFQPLFDEYCNPSPSVDHPVLEVAASEPAVSTGTPSSISVYQDAPSPSGFVDQDNLNHVLKKALYELKQASRAWYDLLSSFLLSQKFSKGTVDPTLFTQKEGNIEHPTDVNDGQNIIKQYSMETSDPVDTPMVEKSKLNADLQGKEVDPTLYLGMIWASLMYLTPVDQTLYLLFACVHDFADAGHACCQDTRRSTYGSMQLLGDKLVSWSSKKKKSKAISSTEAEYIGLSG